MKFLIGFVAGVIVMALLVNAGLVTGPVASPAVVAPDTPAIIAPAITEPGTPAAPAVAAVPATPPVPIPTLVTPAADDAAVADLRTRGLDVPVQGVERRTLQPSYDDARGENRKHQGIDILAPRNTPVVAVENGVIARLFASVPGGLTVYQFDPSHTYTYYYAHLERYADGLLEGMPVTRGQVLGYVGTSGNAPKNTPHLHFEISILTEAKVWWKAAPIDPYLVLK